MYKLATDVKFSQKGGRFLAQSVYCGSIASHSKNSNSIYST